MNLYEVTNGSVGESYVRMYVWAHDIQEAMKFALGKSTPGYVNLGITHLFSDTDKSFATEWSDSGWDAEEVSDD